MKRHRAIFGVLAAGFIGFLAFGDAAFAEQISSQQIVDSLTAPPKILSFADKLGRARSMTLGDHAQGRAAVARAR